LDELLIIQKEKMMKKIVFLFVLFGVLSTQSFAGVGDLFSYDKEKVKGEMEQLTALEEMVSQNQDLTYDDLLASNNPLINNINNDASAMLGINEMPLVPAFWWGCVLGPVGILLVYLIEEDKDQTMSAFWGCVVGSASYTAFYLVWYFVIIATNL
jgi:TRAP-type uncharacterized transport system fused permease subunit